MNHKIIRVGIPTDNLQHILPKQAVTVKHHAAVPVDEAPAAFATLWNKRRAGQGYAAAVTMILCACRSGEVRHMQWDDIVNTTITLPAERMKMRRSHRIPVNWGLALHLSETPRWAGTKLIHPSRSTNRSISDMTIAQAMRRGGLATTPRMAGDLPSQYGPNAKGSPVNWLKISWHILSVRRSNALINGKITLSSVAP